MTCVFAPRSKIGPQNAVLRAYLANCIRVLFDRTLRRLPQNGAVGELQICALACRLLQLRNRHRDELAAGQIGIEIEAGLAFGTGHHGTTAGCLEMIEKVMTAEKPRNALDLGTGSAVLAIAVAKLAPIPVLATDIDPVATEVAAANAKLNEVGEHVEAVTAEEALIVATPRLPIEISGAGDLTAALFLGHLLGGADLATALARTASSVFALIEATIAAGRGELALVAAQDVLVEPRPRFAPAAAA